MFIIILFGIKQQEDILKYSQTVVFRGTPCKFWSFRNPRSIE